LNRLLQYLTSGWFTWRVRATEKIIYLTFDDGPTEELTPKILGTLEKYGAKATFFCVGQNVEELPQVYSLIVAGGHSIGNHTFHHLNGWKTGKSAYIADVSKGDSVIGSALFRPPYGKIKLSQARLLKKHYRLIMWDVLSRDFDKRVSREQCLDRSIKGTRPGSIVVFHDNVKAAENMLYALPRYIEYFKQEGYRFESL
jgi:peptidoglycan/xylan/chitin deacetylase (PgdA/CDA1 family)